MAVDHAALKVELETDPNGYGYAPHITAGSHNVLADLLNLARDGSNGGPAISVNRGTITAHDLVETIVQSEMPTNASQRDWLIMVANGDTVRVNAGSTARAGLQAIFGPATQTRANLTAASFRTGSRGEELFGVPTTVRVDDVSLALAL